MEKNDAWKIPLNIFFYSDEILTLGLVVGGVFLIGLTAPFVIFYFGLRFSLILSLFLEGIFLLFIGGIAVYIGYLLVTFGNKRKKMEKEAERKKEEEWEHLLERAEMEERKERRSGLD